MFVIYGTKGSKKKMVGYGKDFCRSCDREAVVYKYSWLSWFHFFYIPLIPLGRRHEWICQLCSRDANAHTRTTLVKKIFVAIFIIPMCLIFFPAAETTTMKIITLVPVLLISIWIIRHKKIPSKKLLQEKITKPIDKINCIQCNERLTQDPKKLICKPCQLTVYTEIK